MSEFSKAFYINCSVHKEVNHPIWRPCPKCSAVIVYSVEEVKEMIDKAILDYDIEMNRRGANWCTEDWFEFNKKT